MAGGTVEITGGSLTATSGVLVLIDGYADVSGGSLSTTGANSFTIALQNVSSGCILNLSGGTISATAGNYAIFDPTNNSTITISPNVIINGGIDAPNVTYENVKVSTPTATPNGGKFVGSLTVALSSLTPGAEIYYTTNGANPTTTPSDTNKLYSKPFVLKDTTTVKAISAKAHFTDSDVLTVTFTEVPFTSATVAEVKDQAYTGGQIKPVPTVTLNGTQLTHGTHFTIEHKNHTNIGKATITISGIGDLQGTKTVTFKIVPKKTSVSKAIAGKKQVKVTWKKVSAKQNVTKYQVRYKAKGTSKWTTKTVSAKSKTLTLKKLKKSKKYEIQVRSYKKITSGASKGRYNSAWSNTKTSSKVK
jgi:hypothetical protein